MTLEATIGSDTIVSVLQARLGKPGRRWLAELELPVDERLTLDGYLR